MNFRKCQSRNKGFSLVEVFLVTAMLGVVLVALFSAYAAGMKIWRTANRLELAKDRKFVISMENITEEFAGYIRDFKEMNFEGKKSEVSFPFFSGSHAVKITYVFDKNKKYLLRKTVKLSESLKDKMQEKTTKLFDAKSVKFQYLLYDQVENAAYWVSDFSQEENGVPAAVRIDINRNNEDTREFIFIPQ
ncbi:MAG: type II secretion system protein [Candidatus Omnitrophica bacterium]|nr:type II secretion system protein [Candidatus Omnitrophota bacterium]